MTKITFPLKQRMRSPEVNALQEALLLLLKCGALGEDEKARQEWTKALEKERAKQFYGSITGKLVSSFQAERGLQAGGEVDGPTADALNTLLHKFSASEVKPANTANGNTTFLEPHYTVLCRVIDAREKPLAGLRVQLFTQDPQSPPDPLAGPETTGDDGMVVFRFKYSGFTEHPGERGPDLYFKIRRGETALNYVLPGVRNDQGVIRNFRPRREPVILRVDRHYVVTGVLMQANGLPAEKLELFLHHLDFGGETPLLGSTVTDARGRYELAYDPGPGPVNLEIRARDVDNPKQTIPLVKTRFAASARETLNLIAPAPPPAAEYRRLAADLTLYVGRTAKLAGAREDAERRDLTVLNRATGWDARLLALAAVAERLSADKDVNLSPEAVYGLLRAGLPSEKMLLAQVEPDVAEQALKTARDAGIVSLTDREIAEFKTAFRSFAAQAGLDIPAPGSRSTYGQLLDASGVFAQTAQGKQARDRFMEIYLHHHGNAAELWEKARQAGLNENQIRTLQLQGKFAFLAGNSGAMTERLLKKQINGKPIADPRQLVEQDFHRTEVWIEEILAQAGIPANRRAKLTAADQKALDGIIPTAYTGETTEDRLQAYAGDMARKIRASYPTQVVARRLETDSAFKLPAANEATVTLLRNAAAQGFRLGETPAAAFLKNHPDLGKGIAASEAQTAKKQLQMLQRVYQITPNDEAMPVLLSLGLTSAYDVTAYSEDKFTRLFYEAGRKLYNIPPASGLAGLIYRKARQVISVTYNLFGIAKTLASQPPVAGLSPPAQERESVRNELIKHFPTMESLFGSMDFLECKHCRSVLSPAAYLVDLLQFIDPEQTEWDNFLAHWKATHNNNDYPHKDQSGKTMKPYDVLLERRPDLPHIPLTCENTHTALPYIDIVNEILEYYVAHGKLEEKAARDTGDADTGELLAEPQNVIREAYDKLCEARYPLKLPFDLWIETARRFCAYFETPLAQVLETFRPGDELFAPAQPFDRAAIFLESLGLSPAETELFTDPDPLTKNKWHELYGFPADIPFQNPADTGPAHARKAILTVGNADAGKLREGLAFSYFSAGAHALSTDSLRVHSAGAPDSGGAGQTLVTLDGVWSVPPQAGDSLVCVEPESLRSAKLLSRRLGVTYQELAAIVQTGFVNPKLPALVLLYKLGVSVADARLYKDYRSFYEQNKDLTGKTRSALSPADQQRFDNLAQNVPQTKKTGWEILNETAAFEGRLTELAAKFHTTVEQLRTGILDIPFSQVLVLADPDAGGNFDLTTLQYADGTKADPVVFLRINLFVRLWRKLDWSIEELDRALTVFIPSSTPFDRDPAHLARQPLKTALIYLAHLKALAERVDAGKQGRLKLLTLWSQMGVTGKNPLYAQLFLNRGVLKSGEVEIIVNGGRRKISVFDDPLGRYLVPAGLAQIADLVEYEVQLPEVQEAQKIDAAAFAGEERISLYYDTLREIQYLTYRGVLTGAEKARLYALAPSGELSKLLDAVQVKAQEFMFVKGRLLAVQGALGLTADEIDRILADNEKSPATAELSLAHVSLLYRYGLLAKALNLSVRELIALKQLSGLDPFKPLPAGPLETLAEDYPFTQTLRFLEVAAKVKESGLSVEDLEYLLCHIFDPTGKYRPDREGLPALLKTLAEGVRAVRAEHAVPEDPGDMTEETLRQKLGLILPSGVVECFLAMMKGLAEFTAAKTGVAAGDQLRPEDFAGEPAVREVCYDPVRREQKLTYRGVLFDAEKNALLSRLSHLPATILGALLTDVQQQAEAFFTKHLQKKALNARISSGFLEPADFDLLFAPMPAGLTEAEQTNRLRAQRARLAQAFLPFLQQRLIRQFVVQTLTAHTGAGEELVESLVTDERLLAADAGPLLDKLASVAERGLTATFYASPDGTGPALATVFLTGADTGLKDKDGNPLTPTGAGSARLEGCLEVPTPGAYRFYAVLDKQNAQVRLQLAHLPQPTLTGTAAADGAEIGAGADEYAELKPGVPYRFTLVLNNLHGGGARLLVQGETLPKDKLTQLTLYPLAAVTEAERAVVLLAKVLQLTKSLDLSEREIRYLLTHAADFDGLNLSQLPAQSGEDTPAKARALFWQFLRLADYARLKRDLAAGTGDLIDVFEANETGDLNKVYARIAALTRRRDETVKAAAEVLFAAPSFPSEQPLLRLWNALQVIECFGVPAASLRDWTRIVSAGAGQEQRFAIARDLRDMIKARLAPETWRQVARPIFDRLRRRRRDALVAYVMSRYGFDRLEQLYEYFLIDPGMEPVVQTSRIRLAIASVQLFIQRCLLNLEPKAHPSTINSKHWEWMKRYRVWEANRKIFLFPENWLEPEFRDDKTHLFSEVEGALLQGDVSGDLVEDAFLNYLKKLDELARLDIVAMHIEDNADPARRILHVFGRTYSQPYNYFYRRYAHQMWTPWEPVGVEIEGDHLAPVVWRDRLYLFWVTFMDRPDQNGQEGTASGDATLAEAKLSEVMADLKAAGGMKQIELQLHWSEYLNGEWSARRSGAFTPVTTEIEAEYGANAQGPVFMYYSHARAAPTANPAVEKDLGNTAMVYPTATVPLKVPLDFDPKSVFIHVAKEAFDAGGGEQGVEIHLKSAGGKFKHSFLLAGRNSVPEKTGYVSAPANPYSANTVNAAGYSGRGTLRVEFKEQITTEAGKTPVVETKTPAILQLKQSNAYTLLPCDNNLTLGAPEAASLDMIDPAAVAAAVAGGLKEIASLIKPVFYQDNAHTFFIEPNVTEQTIEEWEEWVTPPSPSEPDWHVIPDWWKDIVIGPKQPWKRPIDPRDPWLGVKIHPDALINPRPDQDWLVNPTTVLEFDGNLIGPAGNPGIAVKETGAAGIHTISGRFVDISPGSGLTPGGNVVLTEAAAFAQSGLDQAAGALNVVGRAGLNAALKQNLILNTGAAIPGAETIGR